MYIAFADAAESAAEAPLVDPRTLYAAALAAVPTIHVLRSIYGKYAQHLWMVRALECYKAGRSVQLLIDTGGNDKTNECVTLYDPQISHSELVASSERRSSFAAAGFWQSVAAAGAPGHPPGTLPAGSLGAAEGLWHAPANAGAPKRR
jgi:hypothetical protein